MTIQNSIFRDRIGELYETIIGAIFQILDTHNVRWNREKLFFRFEARYLSVSFDGRREEKCSKGRCSGLSLANIHGWSLPRASWSSFFTRARVEIIEVESRANKLLASGIAESEATVSRVTDCPRRLLARSPARSLARLDAYGNDLMSTSSTALRTPRPRFSWTLLFLLPRPRSTPSSS